MQILTFPLSQLVLPNHLANYSCWHLLYVWFFQTNQYSKIAIGGFLCPSLMWFLWWQIISICKLGICLLLFDKKITFSNGYFFTSLALPFEIEKKISSEVIYIGILLWQNLKWQKTYICEYENLFFVAISNFAIMEEITSNWSLVS